MQKYFRISLHISYYFPLYIDTYKNCCTWIFSYNLKAGRGLGNENCETAIEIIPGFITVLFQSSTKSRNKKPYQCYQILKFSGQQKALTYPGGVGGAVALGAFGFVFFFYLFFYLFFYFFLFSDIFMRKNIWKRIIL